MPDIPETVSPRDHFAAQALVGLLGLASVPDPDGAITGLHGTSIAAAA